MRRRAVRIVHEGTGGEVVSDGELRGELVQGIGSTDVHRAAARIDDEPLDGGGSVILVRGSLSRVEYGEDVHHCVPVTIGRMSIMASRMTMAVMMMTVMVNMLRRREGQKGWGGFLHGFVVRRDGR